MLVQLVALLANASQNHASILVAFSAQFRVATPALAMTTLVQRVSKRSLNFANQRKAYLLRTRQTHDGIVLDDIRDFGFLVRHQEKLQGKVDRVVTFAETPSGKHAYKKWLWRVPLVVTANLTTKNPQLLESDDFLGLPDNRVVVRRQAAPTQPCN